jgi:hypothetical protein
LYVNKIQCHGSKKFSGQVMIFNLPILVWVNVDILRIKYLNLQGTSMCPSHPFHMLSKSIHISTSQEHKWKQLQKRYRKIAISAAMLDDRWKDNFIHDSFVFHAVFRKSLWGSHVSIYRKFKCSCKNRTLDFSDKKLVKYDLQWPTFNWKLTRLAKFTRETS